MSQETPVLEVNNLKKYFNQSTNVLDTLFRRRRSKIQAVDDVSFTLYENESHGVIGESGCGKTTLLMTLMGLYEPTEGEILIKGHDITKMSRKERKRFRSDVQIIFQDPFNSLDPKMRVRETLSEPLKIHDMDDHERRIRDTIEMVELNPVDKYIDRFPRQLSGGEKQRVSIARALIVEPDLILADEPASMLDVSTQAAILNLLSNLLDETGSSMLYISHDLSTVSYICQQINVMYLGRIVERNETRALLNDPKHPYAKALIEAIPIPDPHHHRARTELGGTPRDPIDLGDGCRFRDRCPDRMEVCEKTPEFVELEDGTETACHLYYDHEAYVSGDDEFRAEDVTAASTGND